MALKVLDVEKNAGNTRVKVRIQGDTYEESRSAAAKDMAVIASEIRSPGLDPTLSTYPVDESGKCDDNSMMKAGAQVSGFCTEFIVHG